MTPLQVSRANLWSVLNFDFWHFVGTVVAQRVKKRFPGQLHEVLVGGLPPQPRYEIPNDVQTEIEENTVIIHCNMVQIWESQKEDIKQNYHFRFKNNIF